jgi:hypothetical protein
MWLPPWLWTGVLSKLGLRVIRTEAASSQHPSRIRRTHNTAFETLQDRALLSVTTSLTGGVLTINCDNLGDDFDYYAASLYGVRIGGTDYINVQGRGLGANGANFATSTVSSIIVHGGTGNDTILIDRNGASSFHQTITADGGGGSDVLYIEDANSAHHLDLDYGEVRRRDMSGSPLDHTDYSDFSNLYVLADPDYVTVLPGGATNHLLVDGASVLSIDDSSDSGDYSYGFDTVNYGSPAYPDMRQTVDIESFDWGQTVEILGAQNLNIKGGGGVNSFDLYNTVGDLPIIINSPTAYDGYFVHSQLADETNLTINAGTGNVTLDGDAGFGSNSSITINGGSGTGTWYFPGCGPDSTVTFNGGSGDNYFEAEAGVAASTTLNLVGGSGHNDFYIVDSSPAVNVLSLAAGGTTTIQTGEDALITVGKNTGTGANGMNSILGQLSIDLANTTSGSIVLDNTHGSGEIATIDNPGSTVTATGLGNGTGSAILTNVSSGIQFQFKGSASGTDTLTSTSTGSGQTIGVTNTQITRSDGEPTITYSGIEVLDVTGTAGNDTFNIGGASTGTLVGIAGTINIDGGGGTNNTVNINDQSTTAGYTYSVSSTAVIRGSTTINYKQNNHTQVLNLNTSAGADAISVTSTASGIATTINGGGSGDTYYITQNALGAPLTISDTGTTGTDTIASTSTGSGQSIGVTDTQITRSGKPAITYSGIESLVVSGTVGTDTLTDSTSLTAGEQINFNASSISRSGDEAALTYSAIENVVVNGTPDDDSITFAGNSTSTAAAVLQSITVNGGSGFDTIDFSALSAAVFTNLTAIMLNDSDDVDLSGATAADFPSLRQVAVNGTVLTLEQQSNAIAGVTADQSTTGTLVLTAYGVQSSVSQVNFYFDANNDGIVDTGDQFIGSSTTTATAAGWSASIQLNWDAGLNAWTYNDGTTTTTIGFAPGVNTVIVNDGSGGNATTTFTNTQPQAAGLPIFTRQPDQPIFGFTTAGFMGPVYSGARAAGVDQWTNDAPPSVNVEDQADVVGNLLSDAQSGTVGSAYAEARANGTLGAYSTPAALAGPGLTVNSLVEAGTQALSTEDGGGAWAVVTVGTQTLLNSWQLGDAVQTQENVLVSGNLQFLFAGLTDPGSTIPIQNFTFTVAAAAGHGINVTVNNGVITGYTVDGINIRWPNNGPGAVGVSVNFAWRLPTNSGVGVVYNSLIESISNVGPTAGLSQGGASQVFNLQMNVLGIVP